MFVAVELGVMVAVAKPKAMLPMRSSSLIAFKIGSVDGDASGVGAGVGVGSVGVGFS